MESIPNLRIHFGRCFEKDEWMVDYWFDNYFKEEWFTHPLVQEILKDIAHMTQVVGQAIYVEDIWVPGKIVAISPMKLPGGVKALILMLFTDTMYVADRCGDNCAKYIIEIAKLKPLEISLNYCMAFRQDFEAYVINDGSIIRTYRDYINKMAEYVYTQ